MTARKPKTHWTPSEDRKLFAMVGALPLDRIAALMGRTERGVCHRAERLGITIRQGGHTLHGLCRSSGYDWRQILRAKKALGQGWTRVAKRSTERGDGKGGTWFVITDAQAEAILDYLATETNPPPRWAKGLDRCVRCRRADSRHAGLGLCSRCYQKRKYGGRCKDCGAWAWTLGRLKNVSILRKRNALRPRRAA